MKVGRYQCKVMEWTRQILRTGKTEGEKNEHCTENADYWNRVMENTGDVSEIYHR